MPRRKNTEQQTNLIRFKDDSTLYLPVRDNDFFLYCYFRGMEAEPDQTYYVADIWELRDGNRVTVSNRPCDFPQWFDLHPTEVSGDLVYDMMARLNDGYQPEGMMEGSNIWRVRAGDRLIWVGDSRTGYTSDSGTLHIIEINSCVLVFGEPPNLGPRKTIEFGSLSKDWNKDKKIVKLQDAFSKLLTLGVPKIYSPEWMLG